MSSGKHWRFHHWTYRGDVYLDNYLEWSGTQRGAFTYDALNRLTQAEVSGDGSGLYNRTYAYDPIGNLVNKTGVGTYSYNGTVPVSGCTANTPSLKPHAVDNAGSWSFDYDCAGNMTTRDVGGQYTLSYNAENKLAEAQLNGVTQATYTYDGDGTLVKKVVGGETTIYVGNHFEKNLSTGEVTKYYTLGGRRVAMRRGSTLTYLHGDHLGSASMTTTALGGVDDNMRYYPYGGTRSGTMATDRRFTGQREETAIGLYDYKARYYDPVIGRFIQADTIVPEPGNPQALNRYAYVYGNPLGHLDPSGHDPLGPEWQRDFWRAHNRRPTDLDRQYRLFSLAYRGPISGGKAWTAEDWAFLGSNHNEVYKNLDKRGDLEHFTAAIDRISSYYSKGEEAQFVSGLALLYAGWPYDPTGGNILDMFPSFNGIETPGRHFPDHGMSGFAAHIQNGENTHHYAGHLLLGYHWGRIANVYATNYREVLQWSLGVLTHKPPNDTYQDIRMGWIGGSHGRQLKTGRAKIGQFWQLVYRDLKVK